MNTAEKTTQQVDRIVSSADRIWKIVNPRLEVRSTTLTVTRRARRSSVGCFQKARVQNSSSCGNGGGDADAGHH